MKKFNLKAVLAMAIMLVCGYTQANNIRITGTSVSGSNITFNIAWDNSWYANVAPSNWDAAWVFIKYQDCATQQWAHATLSTVTSDHTASSPLYVETVTDGKGVYVRRNALGGGNITATSVTLKMNIPAGTYNYKVFGIEMVKVLQDTFQIGDATGNYTYNNLTIDAARQAAGISAATLGNNSGIAVPATYPTGYNAFYAMKYEVSQQEYVDFLNTIQYHQQAGHTAVAPNSAAGTLVLGTRAGGNGVVIQTPGSNSAIPAVYGCDFTLGTINDVDDGQNKACNYLTWADLSAFLDWAALRPMSEMEFEKVCRGPVARVAGEYPWGTTNITVVSAVNLNGTATETASTVGNGLCNYYTYINQPMRCGFAATSASGRQSAGAGYYGAMELAGNVYEQTVNTNTTAGAAYTGTTGDGDLNQITGNANVASWPDPTTGVGAGLRGGATGINGATYLLYTSDRYYTSSVMTSRTINAGGRGVR